MMEENEPSQPVESPSPGPAEGGSVEQGSPLRRGASGCASAFLLTLVISLAIGTVAGPTLSSICAVLAAPAAGVFLWWWNRGSRPYFARGSLVFIVVYFVTIGVCVMPPLMYELWDEGMSR